VCVCACVCVYIYIFSYYDCTIHTSLLAKEPYLFCHVCEDSHFCECIWPLLRIDLFRQHISSHTFIANNHLFHLKFSSQIIINFTSHFHCKQPSIPFRISIANHDVFHLTFSSQTMPSCGHKRSNVFICESISLAQTFDSQMIDSQMKATNECLFCASISLAQTFHCTFYISQHI